MATNALDDNQQAAGEKLEGTSRILEGFFHFFLAIIGLPWLGLWATSIIVGGLIMTIRLYNMRKRRKQLRENEELREYMLRDYSEFLGKQTNKTRFDEWQRILVEISESKLTILNQKMLERKLNHKYNLHNDPMLEEILEIAKQGHQSASQQTPHKVSKNRPISPQPSGKEAGDNVAELLRNTSGVVDVKRNVIIGKYIADFIVTNDKGELFCVEVKSSQKNQTIYNNLFSAEPKRVQTQIQSMISAGLPNLTIDGFRKANISAHSRIFIAKLKFQKSKSEEE